MNNDLSDIIRPEDLKQSPFKVPEGYFDKLHDDIMMRVSQQQNEDKQHDTIKVSIATKPKAKHIRMRHITQLAAACVCLLIVISTFYIFKSEKSEDFASTEMVVTEEDFDKAAEYAMLDNHDYYQFFVEN